ncbi:hypothetical protein DJ010_13620 [Nocardioides silvaticus]|uniref:STAS domain-containing protein n=1 Tax=Nocardioides silvaticus TaxID=2201891 RepID=A0A316TIT0_9ACTN|nr:STAS domain-containing protein [Nocardioides silvaticus]PWN02162.1 hypothetical protein DJ010_13620 [Nocardioides silvaticus]
MSVLSPPPRRPPDLVLGSTPDLVGDDTPGSPGFLLDVRIRFTPSLPVVRLGGELDLDSVHLLTDALDSLNVAHCPADLVLLDLTGVTFCDVAGLRGIDRGAEALARSGRELLLYHVPTCVERLMRLTGIGAGLQQR